MVAALKETIEKTKLENNLIIDYFIRTISLICRSYDRSCKTVQTNGLNNGELKSIYFNN